MRFETTKSKFLGAWTYQAQVARAKELKGASRWMESMATGPWTMVGDSFYTNELQDIMSFRIQFNDLIKVIRQSQ